MSNSSYEEKTVCCCRNDFPNAEGGIHVSQLAYCKRDRAAWWQCVELCAGLRGQGAEREIHFMRFGGSAHESASETNSGSGSASERRRGLPDPGTGIGGNPLRWSFALRSRPW